MINRWNDVEARTFSHSDLAMRVYTSRLLGGDSDLVLHGGGNTSVKSTRVNLLGDREEILYIKGSGHDLATIDESGFAPARLDTLRRFGRLPAMSDTDMVRELRASVIDPSAPSPSVEAILHALIPRKFVDHTHTDAVIAISNTPDGEATLRRLYGPRMLILPYAMPGFVLAHQVYEATKSLDFGDLDGILLLHHGLFTFADDAKASYDAMIALVSKAEDHLKSQGAFDAVARSSYQATSQDCLMLAQTRRHASLVYGHPMIAHWKRDELAIGYSAMKGIDSLATRGPVTPDHTLHTKRTPMILADDPASAVEGFARQYGEYFARNNTGSLIPLDSAPRYAVWKNKGCIAFGPNPKRAQIVSDIVDHTLKVVQWSEKLGGWVALPEQEIFELEYWDLQQAKLKLAPQRRDFEGKIVLVTGAASGIGRACANIFLDHGAAVAALDINPAVVDQYKSPGALGIVCDVTDDRSIAQAIQACVATFGGLDIIVSNAGIFPPSLSIEQLDPAPLLKSLTLNFTSHVAMIRACVPYLKLGIDPSIILMASKNVLAPGPGASAYSTAKAALTQFGRIAAMEFGPHGIRVNMLHPHAVFDTGIWTEEVLKKRAANYGMTVEQYKTNNILKTELTSLDVAKLVLTMAGPAFSKITGAQVPIDGGSDLVILGSQLA